MCTKFPDCTSCAGNRITIPYCSCPVGFYDQGVQTCDSTNFFMTLACDYKCASCVAVKTNCSSCKAGRNGVACDCNAGTYDNNTNNPVCSSNTSIPYLGCLLRCVTCINVNNNCVTCFSDRVSVP
jgi:hypothetical protein